MSAALRALLLLLALAGTARAHRLNVEARVEAGRVRVEVYFSDGTAPAGAQVVVVAARDGVEVARGATDAAGAWSFAPTAAGRYAIAVTEPGLHRGQVEVEVRSGDLAAPTSTSAASSASPTTGPSRGGADGWRGTLAGLAAVAALALGLAWWQRRAGVGAAA